MSYVAQCAKMLLKMAGFGAFAFSTAFCSEEPRSSLIVQQPISQTIASGSTVVFSVTGVPGATYQWQLNGVTIAGATGPQLVISGATAANAGNYTCWVTVNLPPIDGEPDIGLAALSAPASLMIAGGTGGVQLIGRLINFSGLAFAGLGNPPLTLGFATQTSDKFPIGQVLLIRAVGPALAQSPFSVRGMLPDPQFKVFANSNFLGGNNPSDGGLDIAEISTGAFTIPSGGPDAWQLRSFAPGTYTVQVSSIGGSTGTILGEVYDDTQSNVITPTSASLVNGSCLSKVNSNSMITVGFVLGGSTSRTLLIRAVGPSLAAAPINLAGTMADPQMVLFSVGNNQETILATNSGWGGDSQIAAVGSSVFAFPLVNAASKDSAILITLPPGMYTTQVSSVAGVAGVVLVEIYLVP